MHWLHGSRSFFGLVDDSMIGFLTFVLAGSPVDYYNLCLACYDRRDHDPVKSLCEAQHNLSIQAHLLDRATTIIQSLSAFDAVPAGADVSLELLGQGGYAKVYKLTYRYQEAEKAKEKAKCFAFKTYKGKMGRGLVNLAKEARLLSVLKHDNIVEFLGRLVKPLGYVMPFFVNSSVAYHLYEAGAHSFLLDWGSIKQVLVGVARALRYLDGQGIIHGDLRSDNVLLHKAPHGVLVPKLADFGQAVKVDSNTKGCRTDYPW